MSTATQKGMELLKELQNKNETVRVNFVADLKQINSNFHSPVTFIQHNDWFYPSDGGTPIVPLPQAGDWDGESDERGLPKDAQLSQQLLDEAKSKAIDHWLQKIRNGDYDEVDEPANANEPEPEAIDMAALARKAKEQKEAKEAGEIIEEKTPEPTPEPEPEPIKPAPAPKPSLGTPSEWRGSTSRVEVTLLNALSDFIASTDSPQDDTPSGDLGDTITKVHDRLDKMEAKQDMLITFMRKAQENFPFLK
jgi:hypothetical protein